MIGGIVYEYSKRKKSIQPIAGKVVQVERQEDASKRSNIWKRYVIISLFIFFIFSFGVFVGYNYGVSYSMHHLLYRDLLNHITPDVRDSFLKTDFTQVCSENTRFGFVECSTNFGLYSSDDLCFICEKEVE